MERSDKPISELLRDLGSQISNMIRHEVGLARAEVAEKADQASSGLFMLAAALVIGLGAVVVLLLSAVAALANVVAVWLAALIVGGVAALLAAVLAASGRSNLRARNLMPRRTVESVRSDAQFAKEQVR